MDGGRREAGARVRLQLLGGFHLSQDAEEIDIPQASQRVLVFLGLQHGPCPRARVAGQLWPTKPEARAAANLRSALWRVPKIEGQPVVCAHATSLTLAPWVGIDTDECERLGWSLVRGEHTDLAHCPKQLFFLELLPGWYDDWLVIERERISQLQLHFLESLALAYLAHGSYADAMDSSLRLVAADPLRERSQRVLMAVYLAEGNLGGARLQLEGYRRLLYDTFQCQPSNELATMVDRAIAGHIDGDLSRQNAGLAV